jgi:hypothetical protein
MAVSLTCRKHPKYLAIHAPRSTTKHPRGCPGCIVIWNAVFCNSPWVFVQRERR